MRSIITIFVLTIGFNFLSAQGLVINEFVASNDSTSMIMDEFGEYDDWVELYNNTSETIDLGGYYLSDDISEPDKWQFPAGISIAADGYLIVWTDNDDEQGDLHTSFKLSKAGEQLILSDNFLAVLDSLTFGEQETNVSLARIPNGTGEFVPRASTFNANNEDGVFVRNINSRDDFDIFPNPANRQIHIDFSKSNGLIDSQTGLLSIYEMGGRRVFSQNLGALTNTSLTTIDINILNDGLYVLKIETNSAVFVKKLMVKLL